MHTRMPCPEVSCPEVPAYRARLYCISCNALKRCTPGLQATDTLPHALLVSCTAKNTHTGGHTAKPKPQSKIHPP